MNYRQIENIIIDTIKPYNPKSIGIFGSYARGESTKKSDIDILVEFYKSICLLDLIGLEIDLKEKLGMNVDLVTMRALNEKLRKYIENDLKIIYE